MIISFTVRNYKSIRDESTLNFEIDTSPEVHRETIAYPDREGKIGVLRTLGIWGANASGKSNLVSALQDLRSFVITSFRNGLDEPIKEYHPFRLDEQSAILPTFFELDFISQNQEHFVYSIEYTQKSVVAEALEYYASSKASLLFCRRQGKEIEFGSKLRGKKSFSCLENQSYLSVAANQVGSAEQIKEAYRYIVHSTAFKISKCASDYSRPWFHNFYDKLGLDELKGLSVLLRCADTGISQLAVSRQSNEQFGSPIFYHNNTQKDFTWDDESSGTLRLLDFASMILWELHSSKVWVIDEIDCNLHPKLVEMIIRLFHDKLINGKNPQLIFTTHDTSLMDSELFRREQICFTQKNTDGATELSCLDEFEGVRADTNFEKWYREGRFEAIPEIQYDALRKLIAESMKASESGVLHE